MNQGPIRNELDIPPEVATVTNNRRWQPRWLALGLLSAFLTTGLAHADDKPDPRGVIVEEIRNPQPDFHVRVSVDHADRIYKSGDELKVSVQSEVDGYLYLLYATAEKKTLLLFPNFVRKDNKIPGGKPVIVPTADARFRLRIVRRTAQKPFSPWSRASP